MNLRICAYNAQWMKGLFHDDDSVRADGDAGERVRALGEVLAAIDADVVGVVEGPDSTNDGSRQAARALGNFAADLGLRTSAVTTGFRSPGQQELAFLYDPRRVEVTHEADARPSFEEEFRMDTDQDGIDELYRHYRPPLEVRIAAAGDADFEPFWAILVHAKSKFIRGPIDFLHWARESGQNRRKLFAEALSIRQRAAALMEEGRDVVVLGDINDGPGMDGQEARFGRSAVELIMGDLFERHRILTSYGGAPVYRDGGWYPSSADFEDTLTHDTVRVLIDHVLASPGIRPAGEGAHRVWNPNQLPEAEPIGQALRTASDHFPVSLDIVR